MVLDAADVQQDGAGVGVARQPVQGQSETDIGIGAQPDDVAEPDSVRSRPVDHRSAERRGLRNQRQPARRRRDMRPRGVQIQPGNRDAEGMCTEDPDPGARGMRAEIIGRHRARWRQSS